MNMTQARAWTFGRALRTGESAHQTISKTIGLAVFASDSLSSVAYAGGEVLLILAVLGATSFWMAIPITVAISVLLIILTFSYRQTIFAYPGGGGASHDKTRAVTTYGAGNVFLASECVGDATFGDQHYKTAGGMDMCLVKLNAAGKALWVSAFGGSKTDRAYGVITDAAGNAYVTGHFESTDAMANGEVLPNAGSYDVFTAKFAPDGKVLWVRVKGGEGYDYGCLLYTSPSPRD